MFQIILTIHLALCLGLIGLVLMQQGRGADAGVALGGGSSSMFGAAGAGSFITRLTTSLAIGFMVTSILLVRAYASFAPDPATATLSDTVVDKLADAPAAGPVGAEPAGTTEKKEGAK